MQPGPPARLALRLIPVRASIPAAQQILLVVAPGQAGHQMYMIAPLAPARDARRERLVGAVDHRCVGMPVEAGVAGHALLEERAVTWPGRWYRRFLHGQCSPAIRGRVLSKKIAQVSGYPRQGCE